MKFIIPANMISISATSVILLYLIGPSLAQSTTNATSLNNLQSQPSSAPLLFQRNQTLINPLNVGPSFAPSTTSTTTTTTTTSTTTTTTTTAAPAVVPSTFAPIPPASTASSLLPSSTTTTTTTTTTTPAPQPMTTAASTSTATTLATPPVVSATSTSTTSTTTPVPPTTIEAELALTTASPAAPSSTPPPSSPLQLSSTSSPFPQPNAAIQDSLDERQVPGPNLVTMAPLPANTTGVQFLKPKSKFKCFSNSDCLNGGMCFNSACFCSPGFTGETCAVNIDECRQVEEPCSNNGICVDEVNQFRCECAAGFAGDRCQDFADMCINSPCLNDAKCINHRTSYTCECEPGWEGKQCEKNTDDCAKNPCKNNATCYDLINDYKCDCGVSGFTGKDCEIDIDECATKPCAFGAKECIDLIGDFKCICYEGFTGNFCEIDVNECVDEKNLCLNGGTCENLHGSYRCNCKEGYRGEKCQEISDYCKAKQPCTTGTCRNVNLGQASSYQCECPSSHIGKRCERKRDCLNECSSHHAHCVNNVTCACLPGRREERTMCEYIASCGQVEGELCLNGGTCTDLEQGGYHCICPEPFYGPTCQYMVEKPQFDVILLIVVTCVGFLLAACAIVCLVIFRSVRKARATRGTYSPSTQEKFGNSASDLLKPPQPERLI